MNLHVRAVAIALVGAVTLVGCAQLPAERSPRAIDRDRVPSLAAVTVTSAGASSVNGVVCFMSQAPDTSDTSNTAETSTPTDPTAPKLNCSEAAFSEVNTRALIDALAAGPNKELRSLGLATQVPQNTTLLDASLDKKQEILTINLSSAINDVSSPNNTLAYWQIVATLTDKANRLGAARVRVLIEGKESKIPTDIGQVPIASPSDFGSTAATGTTSTARRP